MSYLKFNPVYNSHLFEKRRLSALARPEEQQLDLPTESLSIDPVQSRTGCNHGRGGSFACTTLHDTYWSHVSLCVSVGYVLCSVSLCACARACIVFRAIKDIFARKDGLTRKDGKNAGRKEEEGSRVARWRGP